MSDQKSLENDIAEVLNRHSAENASNTPDFLLASYLTACLAAFGVAVTAREKWYGRGPGQPVDAPDDARPAGAP